MLQQSDGISILLVANKHSCTSQNVMRYICMYKYKNYCIYQCILHIIFSHSQLAPLTLKYFNCNLDYISFPYLFLHFYNILLSSFSLFSFTYFFL